MDKTFSYFDFEDVIAHFKAHPPVGGEVELDWSEDEIQNIKDRGAQYGCTVDVFLAAVMECFFTELKRRDAA